MKSPEVKSVGDALRDIDAAGIIESDFLLISGDIVANFDFKSVLQAHKERRTKTDKNSIMTMVLRETNVTHRTRAKSGAGLFILDEVTSRCVRYESAPDPYHLGSIHLDPEVLDEVENISFRNDLIDCHIDICTPDIPALFTENFDYNSIRSDFVKGILTSDILGKTIYAHVLNEKYSARVEGFQTFDSVSRDLISRYAYPVVMERNIMEDQTYSYRSGHVYTEMNVIFAQSCLINPGTVIGSGTFVDEKSSISSSTIGRNCKIGKNVIIEDSYLFDGVEIGDNVRIEKSIVASGAIVKSNAVLKPGVVVSYNVIVGSSCTIESNMKLTKVEEPNESEKDFDNQASVSLLGTDGSGFLFYDSSDDDMSDNESLVSKSGLYNLERLNFSDTSIHSVSAHPKRHHQRSYSSTSAAYTDDDENFRTEAIESVTRSITENHDPDIAALELNTLRMTMNVGYHEVRSATIAAFITFIFKMINTDTLRPKEATERVFVKWIPLLQRQVFDIDDQSDLLSCIYSESVDIEYGEIVLAYAINALYDHDMITEEAVELWWNKAEELPGTKYAKQVVNSIREAESESDSEESD